MITTANVSSADRDELYQHELNKYPAFLHFDGEKKRAGYFVFFALHSILIIFPIIYTAIECIFEDWPVFESTAFVGLILVFVYLPETWFRFYCLYNKFNTALFIGFGGLLVYLSIVSYIQVVSQNTVHYYEELLLVPFYLIQIFIIGWITLVVYIRGKTMSAACRIYKCETDNEIELARIRLFDSKDKKKPVKESNEPTFLDDEPNWNTKTVLSKPERFCPKCGFGLMEGENECHVCGAIMEASEEEEKEDI